MYEERKLKISFRDIALQLLIVVLFVLILLWLFPTKKNVSKYIDGNEQNNDSSYNENNSSNQNDIDNSNTQTTNNNDGNDINENKTYQYIKETEGTYSNYGSWSDWSTNYVAQSDTVEVQTDVRNIKTGTTTYQVKVGTSITKDVIGSIKNNKVFDGYKYNYIREIDSHDELTSNEDYIYILRKYEKKYSCDNGKYLTLKNEYLYCDPKWPPTCDMPNKTEEDNLGKLTTECSGAKLILSNYTYGLYQAEPIYKTSVEDVYGDVEKPIYETRTKDVYSNVTYYRFRTRTYTPGEKITKWSSNANDQSLLNQGYKLISQK